MPAVRRWGDPLRWYGRRSGLVGGGGSVSQCLAVAHRTADAYAGSWWAAVFEGGPRGFARRRRRAGGGGPEALRRAPDPVSRCREAPRVRRAPRSRHPADAAVGGRRRGRRRGASQPTRPWRRSGRALGRAPTGRRHYLMTMTVQQGLAAARRRSGRAVADPTRQAPAAPARSSSTTCSTGRRSLGELDVSRASCGDAGMPEPDSPGRSARTKKNRYYLDLCWDAVTAWSWRSTASTTPGPEQSSATPCGRTRSSSRATRRAAAAAARPPAPRRTTFFDQIDRGPASPAAGPPPPDPSDRPQRHTNRGRLRPRFV